MQKVLQLDMIHLQMKSTMLKLQKVFPHSTYKKHPYSCLNWKEQPLTCKTLCTIWVNTMCLHSISDSSIRVNHERDSKDLSVHTQLVKPWFHHQSTAYRN